MAEVKNKAPLLTGLTGLSFLAEPGRGLDDLICESEFGAGFCIEIAFDPHDGVSELFLCQAFMITARVIDIYQPLH